LRLIGLDRTKVVSLFSELAVAIRHKKPDEKTQVIPNIVGKNSCKELFLGLTDIMVVFGKIIISIILDNRNKKIIDRHSLLLKILLTVLRKTTKKLLLFNLALLIVCLHCIVILY
jgi:hypothetical protein